MPKRITLKSKKYFRLKSIYAYGNVEIQRNRHLFWKSYPQRFKTYDDAKMFIKRKRSFYFLRRKPFYLIKELFAYLFSVIALYERIQFSIARKKIDNDEANTFHVQPDYLRRNPRFKILYRLFTELYIDSYRNYLTQFSYHLESLYSKIQSESPDIVKIQNLLIDLSEEICLKNPDIPNCSKSFKWLIKKSKKGDYKVLTFLIELIFSENGHFLPVSEEKTVLIVEPSTRKLNQLNMLFKERGYKTLRFKQMERCLAYTNSCPHQIQIALFNFDDLLIDLNVIVHRFCQQMQAMILFITDYMDIESVQEKFEITTIDYIKPPVSFETVINKLKIDSDLDQLKISPPALQKQPYHLYIH
ncbi:MAG: hypothetical protein KDD94_12595 [Calditrichaeota bacterium]|nr:hypothetical protein [Calditrichota bacterium]